MTITLVDTLGGNTLVDGSGSALATATAWTGDGADLFATTLLNWTASIIPDATNGGTYDGVIPNTPNKDCTWNITVTLFIDIFAAYTGVITLSVNTRTIQDFTFITNATSLMITNGNDIDCDGNWSVTGTGDGVDHSSGGTIRWGGNITLTNDLSTTRYTSPTVIHHSVATPTAAKSHIIDISENKSRAENVLVRLNQSLNTIERWVTTVVEMEGSNNYKSVGDDIIINGLWITPNNCIYDCGSTAGAEIQFNVVTPTAMNGGNFSFLFPSQTAQNISGIWVTLGDLLARVGASGSVTTTVTVLNGSTVSVRNLQVGNESEPERCTIFVQENNTVLTLTGFALVVEDDTLETNEWRMLTGAIANIASTLTIEAEALSTIESGAILNLTGLYLPAATALIDWQAGSQVNMSADVIIPDATTHDYDGNITVGVGGTSFSLVNGDNNNRFNQLTLTAGCTMAISGTEYADTVTGPTALPKATITGTGTFIVIDAWQNQNFIDIIADTDGAITLALGFDAIDAADYGNATINSTTITESIINGTGDAFLCFRLDVFQSSQNRTTPVTISGTTDATINTVKIGDTVVDTRGGIFTWGSTGILLVSTGGIICNDIDGIQSASFISSLGKGPITVTGGDISIGTNCEINLGSYSNTITFDQDFTVDSTATSSTTNAKLKINGSNPQIVDIMSAVDRVTICKTGGSVQLNDFVAGDLIAEAANGDIYSMDWVQADTHSIANISIVGSGTGKITCQSTVPASQATVTIARNGTVFHTDFQDMNFTGAIVFADSKTCVDLGGNTLSDGVTDGIFFTDIQFPVDNIFKTNRVTQKTIQRRGQTVPAITLSELFTGDDWALQFTFTDDDQVIDLSGVAAIHAAVVSDGSIALIPSTLQADDTIGADWENGKVIVVFSASATSTVIPARNAWIEVQVTQTGGNIFTFPRESIRIVQGVIS